MKCPKCGVNLNTDAIGEYRCPFCLTDFFISENDRQKEICICAAVKAEDGTIIRGHRHRDCMDGIVRRGKNITTKWEDQGFITSTGRYINRIEGYKMQIEAGIKSANPEGYNSGQHLYSEDLY